jgi:hypothetical protein
MLPMLACGIGSSRQLKAQVPSNIKPLIYHMLLLVRPLYRFASSYLCLYAVPCEQSKHLGPGSLQRYRSQLVSARIFV